MVVFVVGLLFDRYVSWIFINTCLGILFLVALIAINPHRGGCDVMFGQSQMRKLCFTCIVTCLIQITFLSIGIRYQFHDLVRSSLPFSVVLSQFARCVIGEALPSKILVWSLQIPKITFRDLENQSNSCLISFELLVWERQLSADSSKRIFKGKLLDLPVALKQHTFVDLVTPDDVAKEATELSRVRHDHVVKFYGISICQPYCYLVTELCDGSLADAIDRQVWGDANSQ